MALEGDEVVLGAGITYTELMAPPLSDLLPGLALASRTVGSPQIRNAGTLGGNLGTASPAGDSLPVLAALDARIVVASPKARRSLALDELIVGPKRTSLEPGEIIAEVRIPAAFGSQEFLKVGTRNAMVIAVANVAVVVDWVGQSVRCALGSVGPVVDPRRARRSGSSPRRSTGRPEPYPGARRPRGVHRPGALRGPANRRPPLHGRLPPPRRGSLRAAGAQSHTDQPRRRDLGAAHRGRADRLQTPGQRPRTRRSRRHGSERASSTCCVSASGSLDRRTPASRASAVPARCSWTASSSAHAWCSRRALSVLTS